VTEEMHGPIECPDLNGLRASLRLPELTMGAVTLRQAHASPATREVSTFCVRCHSVRRFRVICSWEHSSLIPPTHALRLLERKLRLRQFGSEPYSLLPFGRIWRSAALHAVWVQLEFASSRSFPKHQFASLKFWKSIKTGHILGSFCPKKTCKRPSQALRHENIPYHDIFM
jgi:hypothetical protein